MIKITQTYINEILIPIHNWTEESIFDKIYYRSPCKRFTLTPENQTNLCGDGGYSLHVDNSDMSSIAHCEIETRDQLFDIIEIYKNY